MLIRTDVGKEILNLANSSNSSNRQKSGNIIDPILKKSDTRYTEKQSDYNILL